MSVQDHWRRMTAPATNHRRAIIFLSVTVLPGAALLALNPDARYREPAKIEPPVRAVAYVAPVPTAPKRRCYGLGKPCEIVTGGHYGCIDSQTDDRLTSFLVQGDGAAFRNMLSRTLASGECRAWSKGESVFKQIGGLARFCLRSPGAEECYWTAREAVED